MLNTSLVDICKRNATNYSESLAYQFMSHDENIADKLTFFQLHHAACNLADQLQKLTKPQDRVLIILPQGLEFIGSFLGCLYAELIAIPIAYVSINRSKSLFVTIEKIIKNANPSLIILLDENSWVLESSSITPLAKLFVNDINQWLDAPSFAPPSVPSETIALLQYTSGSTGSPKGVVVTHKNLITNLEFIRKAYRLSQDSVAVSWLPHFHDMGLVFGILSGLYNAFPTFLFSPASLMQNPKYWLQAISKYQATITATPNFILDYCVDEIELEHCNDINLSSLEIIMNASEPIYTGSIKRFTEKFSALGLSLNVILPAYGLAESTLIVSTYNLFEPAKQSAPIMLGLQQPDEDFISSGNFLIPEHELLIVNPTTHEVCEDAQIGEIWIKGNSVAQGYWQQPDATKKTFRAYTTKGLGPFLRTGDLGFIRDHYLFVSGRLKDIIIFHGNNYLPQDFERTAEESHIALKRGCSCAFSIMGKDKERIIVICEVKRLFLKKDPTEIVQAIFAAMLILHDVSVDTILLLRPGKILRTTSGKIQRNDCKEAFLQNKFEPFYLYDAAIKEQSDFKFRTPFHDIGSIQTLLFSEIASLLQVVATSIKADNSILSYGFSSIQAVELCKRLSHSLNKKIHPTLLWELPDLAGVCDYMFGLVNDLPTTKHSAVENSISRKLNDEPIAVIGLGCHLPKDITDADRLWDFLLQGINPIDEISKQRKQLTVSSSEFSQSIEDIIYHGGFIEDIADFDPEYFNISTLEAPFLDPQLRMLLQETSTALADSGIPIEEIDSKKVGVFIGACANDFSQILDKCLPKLEHKQFVAANYNISALAGRLAHFFNFCGPAAVYNTACSSSLLAVYEAVQKLRMGECDLAVCAGVNIILNMSFSTALLNAGVLSSEKLCKVFDKNANGYVRSEGCGVVVLKKLSDAQRDKNNIYAIIKGGAVNHDGKSSSSFTAPNVIAQENLFKCSLTNAGLTADQINYIECHGSATALGDAIELRAIEKVYCQNSKRPDPLYLGSVKSNLGHLEPASGITSFIKVVLALKHGVIPPNLHFNAPNEYVNWEQLPLAVVTKPIAWKQNFESYNTAINNYGLTGTNVQIIVGNYNDKNRVNEAPQHKAPLPLFKKNFYWPIPLQKPIDLRALPHESSDVINGDFLNKIAAIVSANSLENYYDFILEVNKLCLHYLVDYLNQHAIDGVIQEDELFDPVNILLKYQPLVRHYLLELIHHDVLAVLEPGKYIFKNPILSQDFDVLKQTYNVFQNELFLIKRCGERLQEIFLGQIDPLSLLFPSDSPYSVENTYSKHLELNLFNDILQIWLSRYVRNHHSDRPLRILEVGAGVGSTSEHLLSSLSSSNVAYYCTDISSYFTNKLRVKFDKYPFASFSKLDIENDPIEQGFIPHGFDIIIISNVLHATTDINIALKNIKKLLSSNGKLVVLELTKPVLWIDFIFGLTEGWWRFNDSRLKRNHPTLNREEWRASLKNCGFNLAQEFSSDVCQFPKSNQITSYISAMNFSLFISEQVDVNVEPSVLIDILKRAMDSQKYVILTSVIKQAISFILNKPLHFIAEEQSFFDMEFDSLLLVSFCHDLNKLFNGQLGITNTELFECPNIEMLTHYMLLKLSLVEDKKAETQFQSSSGSKGTNERIAIIGMGCKFPDAIESPAQLWEKLLNGVDAIKPIPGERWDSNVYYNADKSAADQMYVRKGGFLDDIDLFDNEFFGISKQEADWLDPQHRIMLEVAWRTIEDAIIDPNYLRGKSVGVFIGVISNDYGALIQNSADASKYTPFNTLGNINSTATGRISYFFDFKGPSIAVDTACSSSLVAIHLAAQSILNGDSEIALAGGVNLILVPDHHINLCKGLMLSPEGLCKSFDQDADGYVRSEGCGMVLLKPLSQAIKDGDRIYAVINGTAVNQDGASAGLSAPNQKSQEHVIQSALAASNYTAHDIQFLEAHGTGTPLGDPIEIAAITNTYGVNRHANNPLYITSIKTNLGHLEGAAGVASMIKAALSVYHGYIPAHLHLQQINAAINLTKIPAIIATENILWESPRRIAAVSSFGVSGTNTHAILEQADDNILQESESLPCILTLSAKDQESMQAVLVEYSNYFTNCNKPIRDVAFSSNMGRAHFPYRAAFIMKESSDFADLLQHTNYFISGQNEPRSQAWYFDHDMLTTWDEITQLKKQSPLINEVFNVYFSKLPATLSPGKGNDFLCSFIAQYTLAQALLMCGLKPQCVAGLGVGYIVALTIAEKINVQQAMTLVSLLAANDINNEQEDAGSHSFIESEIEKLNVSKPVIAIINPGAALHQPAFLDAIKTNEHVNIVTFAVENLFKRQDSLSVTSYLSNFTSFRNHELLPMLVATSYVDGTDINWEKVNTIYPGSPKKVSLPQYHFRRQSCWFQALNNEVTNEWHNGYFVPDTRSAQEHQPIFVSEINSVSNPFLYEHQLFKFLVVPGSSYCSYLLDMAWNVDKKSSVAISDITFVEPMILNENTTRTVIMDIDSEKSITISSKEGSTESYTHMLGQMTEAPPFVDEGFDPSIIQDRCFKNERSDALYTYLNELGVELGENFCRLEQYWLGNHEILGKVGTLPHHFTPNTNLTAGMIDSFFQLGMAYLLEFVPDMKHFLVPVSIKQFICRDSQLTPTWVYCVLDQERLKHHEYVFDITIYDAEARLVVKIEKLHAKPMPKQVLLNNFLRQNKGMHYQLTTIKQALDAKFESVAPNDVNWLVVTDGRELAKQVVKQLQIQNFKVNVVYYQESEPDAVNVLLQQLDHNKHYRILLVLNSQAQSQHLDVSPVKTFFHVMNTLIANETLQKTSISLITENIFSYSKLNLNNYPLPVLARTFNAEFNSLHVNHIDVCDFKTEQLAAEKILFELLHSQSPKEFTVIYSGGNRYVQRIEAIQQERSDVIESQFDKDSTYLITGGTGAIGTKLAKKLIESGVRTIVLSARSNTHNTLKPLLQFAQANSVRIEVIASDVAKLEDCKKLFAQIKKTLPPLKGIFHLAGALADGIILNQTWERYQQTIQPKANGAWNLHCLSQDMSLDYFVLFSSLASIIGSKGQSNYSVANAYLDGLARYRQQNNLPALSISWGSWADDGMAAAFHSRHAGAGIHSINSETALEFFCRAIVSSNPHVIIAKMDWNLVSESYSNDTIFLNVLTETPSASTAILQQIIYAKESERFAKIIAYLRDKISASIPTELSKKLDIKQNLVGILDSLSIIDLVNSIQKDFPGIGLNATVIFRWPTMAQLASELISLITETPVKEDLYNFTNEEIESLINDNLFSERTS